MEVENNGELTEMLARLARANGEGDVQAVKLGVGRPRRGEGTEHIDLTLSKEIIAFLRSIPTGDRSKFVNNLLKQEVGLELLSGRFYNYVLMRPDGTVFYVGKGTGNRINDHEKDAHKGVQSYKCNVIRQIWADGGGVLKQKVAFHDTEEDAYELEILLIKFFGRENLTNLTDGGEGATIKHAGETKELHLKFSGELRAHIEKVTKNVDYQAYFDRLVTRDMNQPEERKQ